MCKEAGLSSDGKSNHSLRATAATRMLCAGLPEKVIMDRTGHHCLDGLKPYSRMTALSSATAGFYCTCHLKHYSRKHHYRRREHCY